MFHYFVFEREYCDALLERIYQLMVWLMYVNKTGLEW